MRGGKWYRSCFAYGGECKDPDGRVYDRHDFSHAQPVYCSRRCGFFLYEKCIRGRKHNLVRDIWCYNCGCSDQVRA